MKPTSLSYNVEVILPLGSKASTTVQEEWTVNDAQEGTLGNR
jgi:hypothetical protein